MPRKNEPCTIPITDVEAAYVGQFMPTLAAALLDGLMSSKDAVWDIKLKHRAEYPHGNAKKSWWLDVTDPDGEFDSREGAIFAYVTGSTADIQKSTPMDESPLR